MPNKLQILQLLKDEFNRWEDLLAGLNEDEIIKRNLPSDLSIKDVIAHLYAWQQRSIARLEAALHGREPEFPGWPEGLMPDSEEEGPPDAINAWIHATYQDKPWTSVYQNWKAGFLHLIELAEAIPEEDLMKPDRYAWLAPYPLVAVLEGTYDHHQVEHLEPLLAWLRQKGSAS